MEFDNRKIITFFRQDEDLGILNIEYDEKRVKGRRGLEKFKNRHFSIRMEYLIVSIERK